MEASGNSSVRTLLVSRSDPFPPLLCLWSSSLPSSSLYGHLLKGKARDMGLVLGMVTSTLAQVSSHHAVSFNWTSCFYEPPVAPAADPSTVDVPSVLYAARYALNNPGLATGKVAHN
ncbi:hypothetical protein PRIPAC_73784, partial [Pristionchus pacificus]|uniref:Uncharacterized protein n=1 Tax=Pristionchus pacificus TaxID=54126 RepID=A0A2A6CER3_PRIPA